MRYISGHHSSVNYAAFNYKTRNPASTCSCKYANCFANRQCQLNKNKVHYKWKIRLNKNSEAQSRSEPAVDMKQPKYKLEP